MLKKKCMSSGSRQRKKRKKAGMGKYISEEKMSRKIRKRVSDKKKCKIKMLIEMLGKKSGRLKKWRMKLKKEKVVSTKIDDQNNNEKRIDEN